MDKIFLIIGTEATEGVGEAVFDDFCFVNKQKADEYCARLNRGEIETGLWPVKPGSFRVLEIPVKQ